MVLHLHAQLLLLYDINYDAQYIHMVSVTNLSLWPFTSSPNWKKITPTTRAMQTAVITYIGFIVTLCIAHIITVIFNVEFRFGGFRQNSISRFVH